MLYRKHRSKIVSKKDLIGKAMKTEGAKKLKNNNKYGQDQNGGKKKGCCGGK